MWQVNSPPLEFTLNRLHNQDQANGRPTMSKRMSSGLAGGGLVIVAVSGWLAARDSPSNKKAILQDRVVAGSPTDFMEVRHLVLQGTNEDIGRALATLGRERFQLKSPAANDQLRNRVQRRYLEKNFPIHFDRMRGVASAFGQPIENDAYDFTALGYLLGAGGACSVIYCPPELTADGKGIVSRNFEFGIGTVDNRWPKPGELAVNSRPYVIELHPDRGYASIAICAYDLLGGVVDGVNSEGLTVTVLADDELESKFKMEPAIEGGVGLDELQALRMLLDTCANVDQAKEALLMTKQYYSFIPVHYLIADRHGKAFVWEYSQAHNKEYIVENPGKPLISTNFSLHRHLEKGSVPSVKKAKSVCPRYCALTEKLTSRSEKISIDDVKQCHKVANINPPKMAMGLKPPIRTLWHAVYVPERQSMQVSFYLRDETDPQHAEKTRIVRSDYLEFVLKGADSTHR
jgi:hypothetical protein